MLLQSASRRALEGMQAKLGADHPDTLSYLNNLATLLQQQGKLGEAEPLLRWALEGRQAKLGADHPLRIWQTGSGTQTCQRGSTRSGGMHSQSAAASPL